MGKASSEEAITDTELAETLPTNGISHDASDLFLLEKLIELQPDLVPREPTDYYEAFRKFKEKKPGYTTQRSVADSEGLSSKGSVGQQFRIINAAIEEIREGTFEASKAEIPTLTQERTSIIQKKAKAVQLDPRLLLPPEGHQHYKLARYFQRRRGPRAHEVKKMVSSVLEMGIIEMPTIQAPGSHNGFLHRFLDGEKRLRAWILADEQSGGTDKKPVLEYPVCWVIECTNAEGELIALEKNQNKDNFDVGDRDYSIVLMFENHPQTYTQTRLCELFDLKKSTVSGIISAWRESWPVDVKKGHTPIDNPVRQALVDRQITTYHGRLLTRVKKWPTEQRRLARWLLKEAGKASREDALIIGYNTRVRDETEGRFIQFGYDYTGISSGQLSSMISSATTKMKNAEAVETEVKKLLEKGEIESTISEDDFSTISKKLTNSSSEISKTSMRIGLKDAGIKVQAPKPDVDSKKPTSPATAEAVEQKPVLVCMNCQAYYVNDDNEELNRCMFDIEPTEENECAVQSLFPGRPKNSEYKCPHCEGLTLSKFFDGLDVETSYEHEFDAYSHDVCAIDHLLEEYDIKGKCHECRNDDCQLISHVVESKDPDKGALDIVVNHCPETRWYFSPRPKMSIENINKEVQKRVDKFVKESLKAFEKAKAAEAAGGTA